MKQGHTYNLSGRIMIFIAATEISLFILMALKFVFLLRSGHLFFALLLPLSFAVQGFILYRWIYRPYKNVEKILFLFANGYTMSSVNELELVPTPATGSALEMIRQLLSTNKLFNDSKRQAQYLALQNQINPHFLYNTLEGIRGEAMGAGLDTVAQMTEALGTFFRYTISNVENLVTLDEEISNVNNYFLIQRYRFGERLNLVIEFDSEQDKKLLLKSRIPKLTLQPVVENAIVHGLEGKIGKGTVKIRIVGTKERVIITVSDDGIGMDKQSFEKLNNKINSVFSEYVGQEKEEHGGIAMINVNNRIHLLFGEDYGLSIFSTPGLGTDVEITVPYMDHLPEVMPVEG